MQIKPICNSLDFNSYNGLASILAKGGERMQAYCVKCRAKKEMKDAKVITMKNGKPATQGVCPTCGTKMFRIGKS
jgi:NAD-dependent SIR2 family protein deacetylase